MRLALYEIVLSFRLFLTPPPSSQHALSLSAFGAIKMTETHVNFLSVSPLNRLSWLRTYTPFLTAVLASQKSHLEARIHLFL
ncbi:NPY1_3 [Sanghuangporus vaninii]